jgi:hypothetical protein
MGDLRVIALNPPREVRDSERVGIVRSAGAIPLASNSCHGAALDAWFGVETVDEAIRVARPLGRIVGPTSLNASTAVVLAHDEQYWVAEKAPEMISLRRSL